MTAEQIWDAIARFTGVDRPVVLTVDEISTVVNVSRPTIYKMVELGPDAGGIRALRFLGTIRIPVAEVFRLLGVEFEGRSA